MNHEAINRRIELALGQIHLTALKAGVESIAYEIGKAPKTLYNELERQPGYKLGFDTAIQVIARTGDFSPLDTVEEGFKRVAINVPNGDPSIEEIVTLMMKSIESFGRFIAVTSKCLERCDITENEKEEILRYGYEHRQDDSTLLEAIKGY